MRSSTLGSALVVLILSGLASSPAMEQAAKPAGQPTGPVTTGIRLPDPELKPGQTIGQKDIEALVRASVGGLEGKAESMAGLPEGMGEVILNGLPVGFGTLQRTRNLADPGPALGEQDPRVIPMGQQPFLERIINRSNFLPVGYLSSGVRVARAVARVAVKYQPLPYAGLGTGFMISPTLFMTNNHVIGTVVEADKYELQFNYQFSDDSSQLLQHQKYEFDPGTVFYTNKALDFTIVAVKPRQRSEPGQQAALNAGDEFGFIPLTNEYFYSVNQLANVIQHPNGDHKQIAIQENQVLSIHQDVIRYITDTEPGSSGSPVFNNQWRVIALHHSAGDFDKAANKWLNNEGVRIDRIMDRIKVEAPLIAKQLGL